MLIKRLLSSAFVLSSTASAANLTVLSKNFRTSDVVLKRELSAHWGNVWHGGRFLDNGDGLASVTPASSVVSSDGQFEFPQLDSLEKMRIPIPKKFTVDGQAKLTAIVDGRSAYTNIYESNMSRDRLERLSEQFESQSQELVLIDMKNIPISIQTRKNVFNPNDYLSLEIGFATYDGDNTTKNLRMVKARMINDGVSKETLSEKDLKFENTLVVLPTNGKIRMSVYATHLGSIYTIKSYVIESIEDIEKALAEPLQLK